MEISIAVSKDLQFLDKNDPHIRRQDLLDAIHLNRVYIIEENRHPFGWLRYNLFWDSIPFMTMLYLLDDYRGKGYGRKAVEFWESEMRDLHHGRVMTSTVSTEFAQHFYHKLGYIPIGGFTPAGEPYEIILEKVFG
ncbi:GNAT family N-acetyltransferase [Enterococcus sp. 669A]|uniref:GNAT family N-acetyltransferase n=1 Tax=Candidatus Enterococcus moelleringii TaxID=2815325 RepID=A0ABS3L8L4_9ENTE|nr:GNAT family N-acetyltransferase [Enterococcus sp. 669A]MBO1305945.1 GNAT family N-acetyltransferase [Enterococcus sp. 669A]